MNKALSLLLLSLVLTACNSGSFEAIDCLDGCSDPKVVTTPVIVEVPAPPAPPTDAIQALVDAENDYRESQGQTLLTQGLTCTLYTISGGDRIQASIAGHNTLTGITTVGSYTYKGVFNQGDSNISEGMNVLPPVLRAIYQNMYLLRCQGQLVVTETGYHSFSVRSDDASVLYVAGAKVVDNDNNHGPTTIVGQKLLRKGVYAFRIDYAQSAGGSQALVINMNRALLSNGLLFH